jgi:hypothetical protein
MIEERLEGGEATECAGGRKGEGDGDLGDRNEGRESA